MSIFSKLFSGSSPRNDPPGSPAEPLDYDKMIILDAEDLAEQGIAAAYQKLLPELSKHVEQPAIVQDMIDSEMPGYKVLCNGKEYVIYSANEPESQDESWGRATYFLFLIVNEQLAGTNFRFYAVNGGNDLGGFFLTPEQVKVAQAALPRKTDWPYIPKMEKEWYGQFH
ncbi:MAG TPA: hypothetical protein VFC07_15850 [Verrucomicrobiae bacterium]|nr:hypothetical protein [Verrucomicrobiae bacterium]